MLECCKNLDNRKQITATHTRCAVCNRNHYKIVCETGYFDTSGKDIGVRKEKSRPVIVVVPEAHIPLQSGAVPVTLKDGNAIEIKDGNAIEVKDGNVDS
jgi:hypothetical protein